MPRRTGDPGWPLPAVAAAQVWLANVLLAPLHEVTSPAVTAPYLVASAVSALGSVGLLALAGRNCRRAWLRPSGSAAMTVCAWVVTALAVLAGTGPLTIGRLEPAVFTYCGLALLTSAVAVRSTTGLVRRRAEPAASR